MTGNSWTELSTWGLPHLMGFKPSQFKARDLLFWCMCLPLQPNPPRPASQCRGATQLHCSVLQWLQNFKSHLRPLATHKRIIIHKEALNSFRAKCIKGHHRSPKAQGFISGFRYRRAEVRAKLGWRDTHTHLWHVGLFLWGHGTTFKTLSESFP